MAADVGENYNDLCRLCASKTNVLLGINIFESEGSIREINKKISTCLPVQVHETDQLPKMICADCVYNLDSFFNFREKSVHTENLLIELIKKHNNHTIMNKLDESKMIGSQSTIEMVNNQSTIEMVSTIQGQQLELQNQGLLEHTTEMALVHELTEEENITVEEDIILSSQNIDINHPLDNIELSSHGLATHDIHGQELNLQHGTEMVELVQQDLHMPHSQLTVQNLEMIHAQHNLMAEQYEEMQVKTVEENNEIQRPLITLKNEHDLLAIKIEQDVKNEPIDKRLHIKDNLSDTSDSEDSSDPDFDPNLETSGGEIIKNDDDENRFFIEDHIYEQQKLDFFNSNKVGTSVSADGSQWYYCNVCGKTIADKDDFLSHYEEHINKCILCHAVFTNVDALMAHRRQMHPRRPPNRESKSPMSTKTRTRLKPALKSDNIEESIKEEDSDNDLADNGTPDEDEPDDDDTDKNTKRKRWEPKVCKECGKSYKTNYKLAEHMRKHTGEQPYKCGTCDKAFRSKIGLAQHEAKHTGQYDYSCPTCGKGFQCRSYLIVHQRVHSDLKPYPCTTCGRDFKTKQSLLDHMNRHLGVKPYLCETCGRGFITKGLCKSHQKVHSGMDNRQFPCTVCNKMFVSKSYLATHLRIHTGEKPFMCEVCGKGFLTRVDLRIHSTMHTGEKSFVCEMCGKAFARRDALRCHRRSHTGERPYRCDICGQTFTQFSPMAIHKRLHTGERPYSCEVCSKTFVSRSTMMSHRKKHVP